MKQKSNFTRAIQWLIDNELVASQKDFANGIGCTPVTISRIKRGIVQRPDETTIRKFIAAFGHIINPDYLMGDSDIMLTADAQQKNPPSSGSVSGDTIATTNPTPPDYSSLVNAAIAAKDETIMSLKRELTAKDEAIATKDTLIKTIHQQVEDLRMQVAELRLQAASQKGVYGGVAQWGVAEPDVRTGATR